MTPCTCRICKTLYSDFPVRVLSPKGRERWIMMKTLCPPCFKKEVEKREYRTYAEQELGKA